MKHDFSKFEKKIGISFKNKDLLREAFTHRSYLNECPETGSHNERLEFLGDAVLELVITKHLFKKYPDCNEGDLTSYRAGLVNTGVLSKTASEIGVNDFLLLSKGEKKDIGRARQYILANAYEAIIGAIYQDSGYETAEKFISDNLFPFVKEVVEKKLWQDAKSFFQERVQDTESVTPSYKVISEKGPDHDKTFTVGVFVGREKVAEGEGFSKQEAEQAAAEAGLHIRGWRE